MRILRWAVLCAIVPSLIVFLLNLDHPSFGVLHDDGLYFASAKSWAGSGTHDMPSLPVAHAATRYPPAWPLYLSIAWRLQPGFPESLHLASWMALLPLPMFLFFSALLLFRMGLSERTCALVVCAVGLSPTLVVLAGSLMSELAFCALLVVTLWLAERSAGWKDALLAGVVGGVAFLTRSVALPLLISVPLVFLIRRRRASAMAFLAGMLPLVAGWMLWAKARVGPVGGDYSLAFYFDYSEVMRTTIDADNFWFILWTNTGRLVGVIGRLLVFNLGDTLVSNYLSQLLGLASLWGTVLLHKHLGLSHWGVYSLGLGGMVCLWCFPPVERFLLPVFPLLLAGLLEFGARVWSVLRSAVREKRGTERGIAYAGLGMAGCVVAAWVILTTWGLLEMTPEYFQRYRRTMPDKQAAYEWIRAQTPPDAVFIASADPLLYMHTGRKALGFHLPMKIFYREDRKAVLDWYAAIPWPRGWPPPGYLLWTEDMFDFDITTAEALQLRQRWEREGRIQRVYGNERAAVYKVVAAGRLY